MSCHLCRILCPIPFASANEAGKIVTGTVNLYITLNENYLGPSRVPMQGNIPMNGLGRDSARLVAESSVHELIHPIVEASGQFPTPSQEEAEVKRRTREAMRDLLTFGELDDADPIEVQQTRARCAPIEQQCIIFLGQVHPSCHVCSGEGVDYVRTCVAQTDASCLPVMPATEQIDMCVSSDPTQFPCIMFPPYPYDS